MRDWGDDRAAEREAEGSNSRYAEPDAEGIKPVFKTSQDDVSDSAIHKRIAEGTQFLHIFRKSVGCL